MSNTKFYFSCNWYFLYEKNAKKTAEIDDIYITNKAFSLGKKSKNNTTILEIKSTIRKILDNFNLISLVSEIGRLKKGWNNIVAINKNKKL